MSITIPVSEIETGDQFVADGVLQWTALEDAGTEAPIILTVLFRDGGRGERIWDDPQMPLEITR